MEHRSDRLPAHSRRAFLALTAAITGAGMMTLKGGTAFALGTSEAETFVTAVLEELRVLIENGRDGPEGAAEFLALLEKRASLDAVGRFAAGRAWRDMTDAQQNAYSTAFRTYISNTYQNRFGEYQGEDIEVAGSSDAGSKGVLVKSILKRPNAESVNVEWLVSDRGDGTRLSDIIFEGVSLAITLRETFGGMIEKRGGNLDQFIADLSVSKGA
jgi:phospholipid transport system substrate-binding protein